MMDSKLKCVFVMPPSAQNLGVSSGGAENNGDDASVRSEYTAAASSQMRANIPPSPKVRTVGGKKRPCHTCESEASRL